MSRSSAKLFAFVAAAVAAFGVRASVAEPAVAQVAAEAQRLSELTGGSGGDLSPLLATDREASVVLARRPSSAGLVQIVSSDPPVRLHVAGVGLAPLSDVNLDGIPDRAGEALAVVVRTLQAARQAGLGSFGDDGDGELDLYLLPLGGAARGYAVIERIDPPGPGGSGFGVIDISHQQERSAFLGMVARVTARLVLAAKDADAPSFWREASALWLEERGFAASPEMAYALQARWSRPELGIDVGAPPVARGNAGLLWSLGDDATEARAIAATWTALATRGPTETPREAILRALTGTSGLAAGEIVARAAAQQLVHGLPPQRFAFDATGGRDAAAEPRTIHVARLGAALLRLGPTDSSEGSTRVTLVPDSQDFLAEVVARHRDGGWERSRLFSRGPGFDVTIPWTEYQEAFVILARSDSVLGAGDVIVRVDDGDGRAPFGLASFGGRATDRQRVEIQWESTWERGLFGWLVERAPAREGPWGFIETLPAPSLGTPIRGGSYTLVDTLASEASEFHYRLVAVTEDGLRLTGPAIVVAR